MARRNRTLVPQARAGLDTWKYEIASSVGITDYARADKGELTSRQNGSVGGEMTKRMVEAFEKKL